MLPHKRGGFFRFAVFFGEEGSVYLSGVVQYALWHKPQTDEKNHPRHLCANQNTNMVYPDDVLKLSLEKHPRGWNKIITPFVLAEKALGNHEISKKVVFVTCSSRKT